ncbi:EF-hand domain-containing protein [Sphingomonas sp. PB2P19]|uniref:EF-hand domain-containing protein n=1 Tax=Sphingomonas rhamnosi TaxID=3096156 RepID=UPI002FCA9872
MILLLLALLQAAPEIVVVAPPKATAQTPATIVVEPAAMFAAACDANGDALVTRAELSDCVARSFAGAESGSMRYLAYSDWALRWLGDRTALPAPFDADRDGDNVITVAELQAQFAKLFSRWDRDHDGELTRAELLTFKTRPIDANGPTTPARPGDKPGRKPR